MANICDKCKHRIVCKYRDTCDECNQFATDNNVGSKLPILCQNCSNHTDVACPENKVWCKKLSRYMKADGYCSYGERKDNE